MCCVMTDDSDSSIFFILFTVSLMSSLIHQHTLVSLGNTISRPKTGRALDLQLTGCRFDYWPERHCLTTLGNLLTPICLLSSSSTTWYWPWGSDAVWLGRLLQARRKVPPGWQVHDCVTCRLTAIWQVSAADPMLSFEYRTYLFY